MSPQSRISHVKILSFAVALLFMGSVQARAQVQLFKAPQAFPAGPNPVAEATGDFNGDGKIDVAVANSSAGTVSVMLSNGDGTFQPRKSFAAGNGPSAIVAGDFNGDGKLDLAVANSADGSVGILLGNGNGTFQAAVSYTVAAGASKMTVGDFNGDGKLDLAVTNALINGVGGTTMSVLLGNGDGTFQISGSYVTGYPYHCRYTTCSSQMSWWIAAGDFNGDGKPDLLLAAYQSSTYCNFRGCHTTASSFLEFFAGNGDGTFQNYVSCCSVAGVFGGLGAVVADFNGDGKLDVASAFGNIAYVFFGNGDGTFQGPAIYGVGLGNGSGPLVGAALLAVGDLNGNGKLDLAVTSDPGGVNVLLGNGDGTFQAAVGYPAGPSAHAIAIGDFDGDGKTDLVVTNAIEGSAITVLLGNGDGTFGPEAPAFQLGGGTQPLSLAVGDFNGDGKLDYVVADSSGINSGSPGISVVLGNGDGTFQLADFIATAQGNPAGVATADLNGDGKLDLAVANGGTGVLVLLGNGDGTFQPPVSYSTPDIGSYPGVAVADLNGDSKPDLAVTDGNGHVDILLGNGDGTFKAAVSFASGQACTASSVLICMENPAIGDFNGDGKLDLAVTDVAANTLNILLGNGDGTFQAPVTYSVGAQPTAVAVADFDADGKLDLAVGNNGGSTISILLGKGDGTFKPAMNYPVAGTPGAIVVGDFNGDGILDVAAQGSGMASVLLGKGDGTFQAQLNYAFGDAQFASGIAAGDFNGDHMLELVVGGGLGTFGDTTAAFLLNVVGPGYVLYLTKGGTGAGTVTSVPSGLNCKPTCSARFAPGATVRLTATANSTSNFTGWSGACSGRGTCSVAMNAAASVTANFALQDFSLTPASTELSVQPGGQGTDVMTIVGLNGPFTNAIQLTCAIKGPAPLPACSLSATTVTPGTNSVTSTLTITAPASAVALEAPLSRQQSKFFYALWLPFLFGITVVGRARKVRRGYWAPCGVLLLLLVLQTACGTGSSSFSSGGNGNNGDGAGAPPPTSYTATVMATSGALQHTIQVGLTVQ